MAIDVKHIVLTGGPCAGKSSGISIIEQRLTDLGYKVVILSEMATDVINSGIHPSVFGNEFQDLLIKLQLYRDNAIEEALNKQFSDLKQDKVIVIHDRGIMDGMAYTDKEEFTKLLAKYSTNIQEIYNKYDGVFHLVTAAIGATEYYTLSNNKARMETAEQAAEMDKKTLNCWVGHPHLRIINNINRENVKITFEEKMNILTKEIMSLLGEPMPLEIERKYLIKMPSKQVLESLGADKQEIIQTYLISDDNSSEENRNTERRIRQRGKDGNYSYYYTEKTEISSATRIENERKITEKEYLNLLMQADTSKHQIKKDRYCFVYKDRYFELDVYPFWDDKAILEIEVASCDEKFEIPDAIKVIKDVTDDIKYKNSSLATSNPLN